jgi:hypothetical protein
MIAPYIEHFEAANQFYEAAKYTRIQTPSLISSDTVNKYTGDSCIQLDKSNFIPKLPEQSLIEKFLKNELSYKRYFNLISCLNRDNSNYEYKSSYDIGLIDLNQYEQKDRSYYLKLMLADVCYFIQSLIGNYDMEIDVNCISDYLYKIFVNETPISYCQLNFASDYSFHWISGIGLSEPLLSDLINNRKNG